MRALRIALLTGLWLLIVTAGPAGASTTHRHHHATPEPYAGCALVLTLGALTTRTLTRRRTKTADRTPQPH